MSTAQDTTREAPHVTLPCGACGRWNRIAAKRMTDVSTGPSAKKKFSNAECAAVKAEIDRP